MRQICYTCLRPVANCFCTYLVPFDPGVTFVFLMHPKEAKRQRTGTGRLAHAGLLTSEIIVGIDFTQNARLNALLSDGRYFPVLLYPGNDARTASTPGFREELGGRRILALVIDSTWFCAKKILEHSPAVAALPKISFAGSYTSIFTFKREPRPECISTIESCYYLVRELGSAGITAPNTAGEEGLMAAFRAMIRFQLQKENDRIAGKLPNTHATDYKYTRIKEIPEFLRKGTGAEHAPE